MKVSPMKIIIRGNLLNCLHRKCLINGEEIT
nr:MAG TPA_asm: hypothetical protein [Caudoviricetes sp.]